MNFEQTSLKFSLTSHNLLMMCCKAHTSILHHYVKPLKFAPHYWPVLSNSWEINKIAWKPREKYKNHAKLCKNHPKSCKHLAIIVQCYMLSVMFIDNANIPTTLYKHLAMSQMNYNVARNFTRKFFRMFFSRGACPQAPPRRMLPPLIIGSDYGPHQ